MTTTEEELLTVDDLAGHWRCGRRTVLNAIERGDLLAAKIGGRWVITSEDAAEFKRTRMNRQPARQKRTRAPRARASR